MPIEIKELHIRVAVSNTPGRQATAAQNTAGTGAKSENGEKDNIVAECVEQVLQILQARKER